MHFYGLHRVMQFIGLHARDLRIVEFESELSDGSFVTTSNCTEAAKVSEFPGISRQFLWKSVTPAELYAAQRAPAKSSFGEAGHSAIQFQVVR